MSLLTSVPPEIISRIFQSCSTFADVVSLAGSSKRLKSIWVSHNVNIIWEVGTRSILSFNEALISVRATSIVHIAQLAVTLPPIIDLPSLSGKNRKPTLAELKSILDLRHFVRYIEYQFMRRENTAASWGTDAIHLLDEDDGLHLMQNWREGFYRAVYRLFIAGAVLSRAYKEPFFQPEDLDPTGAPKRFLHEAAWMIRYAEEGSSVYPHAQISSLPMSKAELDILSTYPVYNFTPHEGWEECFGPLGDWLIEETRERVLCEGGDGDRAVLREVMQLLVAFGQLRDGGGGVWGGYSPPWWRIHRLENDDGVCLCSGERSGSNAVWGQGEHDSDEEEEEEKEEASSLPTTKTRTIPLIFFGTFEVHECIISDSKDFNETSYHGSVEQEYNPQTPRIPNLDILSRILHCMSGRGNHINNHPAPHPPLHFFSFLLRKYFAYQFDELAFETIGPRPVYASFIQGGRIFMDEGRGGDWEGVLTSVEEVQRLRFGQIGYTVD